MASAVRTSRPCALCAPLLLALLSLSAATTRAAATRAPPAPPHAAAVLSLNTTVLNAAGDWLTVSWRGVKESSPSDFLALLPDGASIDQTSPLKIKPTGGAATGNASFRMLNWRTPQRWWLFRGGLAAPQPLAQSPVLTWRDPNEPTGAHLSLTGTPGEMRVQWTTHNESAPLLFLGDAPGAYTRTVAATSSMLGRGDMCGDAQVNWTPSRPNELTSNATGMGWIDPGTQHSAVMTGLVPDQRYFYALGSADEGAKGAEWSFVQPLEADATATLRFAVAADMGATEVDGSNWDDSRVVAPLVELSMRGWDNRPAANTSARLLEEVRAGAALTLINGDISYARGFGAVWEAFMDAVQPFAASAPLHTVPGNHESNWPGVASSWNTSSLDSGGECGAAYTHRFPMPAPASRDAPWYSVDAGPVHFVHFSTEHDVSPGASQLAWLAADLAAARAAGARWIVLVAHRFFYVQSSTPGRDTASGRALLDGGLEALMLQYGVDVTLTGHHHSYQRSCPVAHGTCVPLRADGSAAAPVHVVAGHAGAGISGVTGSSPVITHIALENGFVSGFANATHLVLTSRRSSDGSELDKLVLFKPASAR